MKLWFVLRTFGLEGLRAHIRHGFSLAAEFEQLVKNDEAKRFEIFTEPQLALVCFRLNHKLARLSSMPLKDQNVLNKRLLDAVNETGKAFMVHTELASHLVLRFAPGNPMTKEIHVQNTFRLVCQEADKILASL